MEWLKCELNFQTQGQALYPITDTVNQQIRTWQIWEGMCYLFIQHTSASLLINESFDPTARMDMAQFLLTLAPTNQVWYRHTMEGDDDSPSHLKAMIMPVDLSIPIDDGRLSLGTWQGIYLCEHRKLRQQRTILLRCMKAA
jgi:secondary thiamine-phosphate synthase enzyme